eukprot:scaffold92968_cov20-Phaeocystis_antarctica.AAC.2
MHGIHSRMVGCVELCSPHAFATCAVRCEISVGEISLGDPSGRGPVGWVLPLRCPAQGEQHTRHRGAQSSVH